MKVHHFSALLLAGALLTAPACKKDDDHDHAQENITTVVLTFTGDNGFNATATWSDPDGAGGNQPTIDPLVLPANETYSVSVRFEDRSKTPAVDLTPEILAEATEHLVTFLPEAGGANVTVAYTDQDANGRPLGLQTTWTTGTTSIGPVKVRLHHEPTDKNNAASPGGETDVEVEFSVRVL